MNNFARAHNSWLEPPDDDPVCEDCGETLYKHPWNDGWICTNRFCPTKFQGVEKEMAEALVDALEDVRTYKRYKVYYVELKEKYAELEYKWNDTNK